MIDPLLAVWIVAGIYAFILFMVMQHQEKGSINMKDVGKGCVMALMGPLSAIVGTTAYLSDHKGFQAWANKPRFNCRSKE